MRLLMSEFSYKRRFQERQYDARKEFLQGTHRHGSRVRIMQRGAD